MELLLWSAYRKMTWSFPGNFSRWRRAHPTFLGGPEWLKRIAHSQPKSLHIFIFRNQGNRNRFPKTLSLRGWCMVSPSASWTSCHRGPRGEAKPSFLPDLGPDSDDVASSRAGRKDVSSVYYKIACVIRKRCQSALFKTLFSQVVLPKCILAQTTSASKIPRYIKRFT